MGKINLKQGMQGRITGALLGGVGSAVWDSYLTPMLPDSLQNSPDIVKMVAGAFMPSLIKNDMGRSLGDGLMMVGIANYASNNFFDETKTSTGTGTTPTPAATGVGNINPFAAYSHRIMVNGASDGERAPRAARNSVAGGHNYRKVG